MVVTVSPCPEDNSATAPKGTSQDANAKASAAIVKDRATRMGAMVSTVSAQANLFSAAPAVEAAAILNHSLALTMVVLVSIFPIKASGFVPDHFKDAHASSPAGPLLGLAARTDAMGSMACAPLELSMVVLALDFSRGRRECSLDGVRTYESFGLDRQ